ncbi:hypothetical protein U1Q18_049452 [Sarracenia purpurea var. burkii]
MTVDEDTFAVPCPAICMSDFVIALVVVVLCAYSYRLRNSLMQKNQRWELRDRFLFAFTVWKLRTRWSVF